MNKVKFFVVLYVVEQLPKYKNSIQSTSTDISTFRVFEVHIKPFVDVEVLCSFYLQ